MDPVTDRQIEPATPTAPVAAPLACASPVAAGEERKAVGGFEELWRSYAYPKGKREARLAYEKLAPDADLHATMVAAAIEWRETWAAQGKSDAPRFTLAKWIEREEYECAPPTAYTPKERKAKPALESLAAPGGKPDLPPGHPVGRFVVEIVAFDYLGGKFDPEVPVGITLASDQFMGALKYEVLVASSVNRNAAERGYRMIDEILLALEVTSTKDTDDLLFKPLLATISKTGLISYSKAPADAVAVAVRDEAA